MSWSGNIIKRALAINTKFINYNAVKTIKIQFDPFLKSSESLRDVMYVLAAPKYRSTNLNTGLKIDVKCDRSQPLMEVKFNDAHTALFKTEHLSSVEIVQQFNKLCRNRENLIAEKLQAKKKR